MIKCDLLVIIPAYDEENRLKGSFFLDYLDGKKDVLFLFVNDGSNDETLEVLKALKRKHNSINYLSIVKNIGKGNAIREAIL